MERQGHEVRKVPFAWTQLKSDMCRVEKWSLWTYNTHACIRCFLHVLLSVPCIGTAGCPVGGGGCGVYSEEAP